MQFYGKTQSFLNFLNLFTLINQTNHSYTTHSSLTAQVTDHRVSKKEAFKQNHLCGSGGPESCRGTGSACGVVEVMRKERGLVGGLTAFLRNSEEGHYRGFHSHWELRKPAYQQRQDVYSTLFRNAKITPNPQTNTTLMLQHCLWARTKQLSVKCSLVLIPNVKLFC